MPEGGTGEERNRMALYRQPKHPLLLQHKMHFQTRTEKKGSTMHAKLSQRFKLPLEGLGADRSQALEFSSFTSTGLRL